MGRVGEVIVECPVGGEVVTGSTRMKSGTAQKMVRYQFGVK
jgi:N-acetylmuramic acid 6-phosphate (MurNAc-6-P) etherase